MAGPLAPCKNEGSSSKAGYSWVQRSREGEATVFRWECPVPTRTTCPLSHTVTSPPVPLGLDCLGKGVSQALPSSNNREEERLRVRDQLLVFCLFSDLGACMDACLLLLLLLSRFSCVWRCATPQTAARQAPPSLRFFRQEHWSGLPFPSPTHKSEKWKWSRSVVSNS